MIKLSQFKNHIEFEYQGYPRQKAFGSYFILSTFKNIFGEIGVRGTTKNSIICNGSFDLTKVKNMENYDNYAVFSEIIAFYIPEINRLSK